MKWRDQGLDLSDERAVAERVSIMRQSAERASDAPTNGSESLAEAKRRRASADADLAEMRAKREAGELIDLATVQQSFSEVGASVRARLLALPAALVSELEGLTGSQIYNALQKRIHELLTAIHENLPLPQIAVAEIHAAQTSGNPKISKTANRPTVKKPVRSSSMANKPVCKRTPKGRTK